MMVVTASDKYAYRREDGIYIVPIGCLNELISLNCLLI